MFCEDKENRENTDTMLHGLISVVMRGNIMFSI